VTAEGSVPPDSPWFSGHFPHDPILPGIAQLSMVFDAIRRSAPDGTEVQFTGVRRVRFKQVIRPDEPVRVAAAPVGPGKDVFAFRIMINEEIACSGNVTALFSGDRAKHGDG
jgi:3-hydroxymyristoyl/3-hydroxydecanoyl-(acyl carrier protein) dehydratase